MKSVSPDAALGRPLRPLRVAVERGVQSSIVLGVMSRVTRQSTISRFVAALMTPSYEYLAPPNPAQAAERSKDEMAWFVDLLRGSAAVRALVHVSETPLLNWRDSRVTGVWRRFQGRFEALAPDQQIHLTGTTLMTGTVVGGLCLRLTQGPWPWPTVLLWAAVSTAGAVMVFAPRVVVAAWRDYCANRATS